MSRLAQRFAQLQAENKKAFSNSVANAIDAIPTLRAKVQLNPKDKSAQEALKKALREAETAAKTFKTSNTLLPKYCNGGCLVS